MQKQRQMINICDINTYIDIIGSAIIVIELYVLFSMWRKQKMRIFDLYSKVASLPDGEYFFINKIFFSWKICVIKKDFELTKKYFYQGNEELDFEETSEKYRFFCAMMQSDDWEMLQSKNKKSETAENKNV